MDKAIMTSLIVLGKPRLETERLPILMFDQKTEKLQLVSHLLGAR